jgi:serine/threonine-protein kinase HipA
MEKGVLTYVDLDGVPHFVGRLWARARQKKESASFEYDPAWLQNPVSFSLEPALQLGPGPFTRRTTFRCSVQSAIQRLIAGDERS